MPDRWPDIQRKGSLKQAHSLPSSAAALVRIRGWEPGRAFYTLNAAERLKRKIVSQLLSPSREEMKNVRGSLSFPELPQPLWNNVLFHIALSLEHSHFPLHLWEISMHWNTICKGVPVHVPWRQCQYNGRLVNTILTSPLMSGDILKAI